MSDCCFSVAFSSIQLFVVWSQIILWTWLALIGFSVEQQSYVGKDLLTPLSLFSCLKSDSFSGSLKYWFFKCTVMDSVPPICSFILQMISWADTKLFWCDLTLNSDFFFPFIWDSTAECLKGKVSVSNVWVEAKAAMFSLTNNYWWDRLKLHSNQKFKFKMWIWMHFQSPCQLTGASSGQKIIHLHLCI